MPPRAQHCPTGRTTQKTTDKLSIDPRLLDAYDQHRVPPPASKRALPTTTKQTGGLSRVQKRQKPANPAETMITTTNGTSTTARAQTQRRSTAYFGPRPCWLVVGR